MGFEDFQHLTLPYNGPSPSDSLDMEQPNVNLGYNVSTSSFPRDMEQGSFYNTGMDPYMSLPSNAMSFPGNYSMNEVQQSESMEGPKRPRKANSPASRSDKAKKDPSRSTSSPKKSKVDGISRENQLQRPVLCSPVLDESICARRLKQYLFHMRNNASDNGITYWKEFVSEYYAPGSRKRWCFCKYENFQVQSAGVFYPKSMGVWSCDICGSRSGKGLEAKFDIFPRLLMSKFESGMRDEIFFLDSPRSGSVPCGLMLEYGKATIESVYENYRVAHEGILRIVFGYDLKILSWEFCAHNHEDFLLRSLVTPHVNQLVQVSKAFLSEEFSRASSEDLHILCDAFVSAGGQLARNMATPPVNALGYPKRFIRCLQIAEVADSMKDIMSLSLQTSMGPMDCWSIIKSQVSNARNYHQTKEIFAGPQSLHQMSENSAASMRRRGKDAYSPLTSQSFVHGRDDNRLLHEIVSAGIGESSISASVQSNSVTAARSDFSMAVGVGRSVSAKTEQCSPEEAYQRGFAKTEE